MTRNKLYSLLLIACLSGFIYLFCYVQTTKEHNFSACIIKNLTGYPCPSCGTTRAVLFLLKGEIAESLLLNPFGIIVSVIMVVFPFWVLTDVFFKKETFYFWYKKAEGTIRKPALAVLLILLVLLNWIWNIFKNL